MRHNHVVKLVRYERGAEKTFRVNCGTIECKTQAEAEKIAKVLNDHKFTADAMVRVPLHHGGSVLLTHGDIEDLLASYSLQPTILLDNEDDAKLLRTVQQFPKP